MKKLALFSSILIALVLGFSFSPVLATDGNMQSAGNTIKNAADGAKNVVQGAITGTENVVSNGANGVKNATGNVGNTAKAATTTNTTNGTYTANRTATNTPVKVAGMTATTWTWLIVAVLGALIIGLIYYYAKQNNTTTSSHMDE